VNRNKSARFICDGLKTFEGRERSWLALPEGLSCVAQPLGVPEESLLQKRVGCQIQQAWVDG
jgi:hypothetical protein